MRSQTITWTALPKARTASFLALSVFASPRMKTDVDLPAPGLKQFPDFLDWPAVNVSFKVLLPNSPPLKATRVGPPTRSDLWKALFNESTFVRPFEFPPFHLRFIRSYPVRQVMSFLKTQYLNFASGSPEAYPAVADLLDPKSFGPIAFGVPPTATTVSLPDSEATATAQVQAALARRFAIPPSETQNPPMDFVQLKLFHRPRNAPDPKPKKSYALGPDAQKSYQYVRPQVKTPDIDFHEMLAALAGYPDLMRLLGLIVDIEIPLPSGAVPSGGEVQVEAAWTPSLPDGPGFKTFNFAPKTRYQLSASQFIAAPRQVSPLLADGLLKLSDASRYEVVQVDADGAAMKALNFAAGIARAQTAKHITDDTPDQYSLPSLRSGGIAVARVGRAFDLHLAFAKSKDLNDAIEAPVPQTITLDAEDLVRGYRVDVHEWRTGLWQSLLTRSGEYNFLKLNEALAIDDEGWVGSAATSASDGSSTDFFLHEQLFTWRGWSLAAPRPGKTINKHDSPEAVQNKAAAGLQLEVNHSVPKGTLPRLRFGQKYSVRARAVDLAGNSVPFDQKSPNFNQSAGPITYGRFEPVASPTVVLRKPRTPGESLERVVIRSNFDTPAAATSERHLAPPKTDQLTAEQHGMFDLAVGVDQDARALIVARESAGYATGGDKDVSNYGLPSFDVDSLPVPYLPDPIARGAAFTGLPGVPAGSTRKVDFDNPAETWPEAKSIRLLVREGAGSSAFDAVTRVLSVSLPKAAMIEVKFSSYIDERDLDLMGLWRWLREDGGLSQSKLEELQDLVTQGRHWMFTPYRKLTLVHAVQQPLLAPAFSDGFANVRSLGQTFTTVSDQMPISGMSTAKVNLHAEWKEPIDASGEKTWRTIGGRADPIEVPLPYSSTVANINHRHEFGDTKHRVVEYSAVATTRFRDYFPPGTQPLTRSSAGARTLSVPNSARPASPRVRYVVPAFGWDRNSSSTGVTSKRSGGGLRVYLERPWWSSGEGELLGVVLPPATDGGARIAAGGTSPQVLAPYVTRWGIDPIWKSQPVPAGPNVSDFANAARSATGLTLEEAPGGNVDVAGHEVGFDDSRGLWYCDIVIAPGNSYFPFVRLALARFQPVSVPDAHLSRVVLADFAQLAPDRAATIAFDPVNSKAVTVTVSKPGYEYSADVQGPALLEVTVEERALDVAGGLGWVPVPDGAVALPVIASPEGPIWSGQVELPVGRGSKPLRLVLREYEVHLTQPGADAAQTKTDRRLVYADAIEI